MLKKLLALILALVMVLSLVACSSDDAASDNDSDEASEDARSKDNKTDGNGISSSDEGFVAPEPVFGELNLELVASYPQADEACRGGFIYSDDTGYYGIISQDGKTDSGAIYDEVYCLAEYFVVRREAITDYKDLSQVNGYGLVDGNGKVLLAEEYAEIDTVSSENTRYVKAWKATNVGAEGTLSNYFLRQYTYTETLDYEGNWCVIDTKTGAFLPASGTIDPWDYAIGDFYCYTDDQGRDHVLTSDGKPVDDDVSVYENNTYVISKESSTKVYDIDGTLLFSLGKGQNVVDVENGYFMISSHFGETKYFLTDRNGKRCSVNFSEFILPAGNFVTVGGDELYTLDGKKVLDLKNSILDVDPFYGDYYRVYTEETVEAIIRTDGTVVYKSDENAGISVYSGYYLASKSSEYSDYFYSLKDKDFTLKGRTMFIPFLVMVRDESYRCSLYNVITGECILTDGYTAMDYGIFEDGAYYFSANKADGSVELYKVS